MNSKQFEIPFLEEIHEILEGIESKVDSMRQTNSLNGKWLNTKQAAKALDVTTRTLQTYRDRGLIPFSQFGREIRYRAEDIQTFLMAHYVKPNNWEGGAS